MKRLILAALLLALLATPLVIRTYRGSRVLAPAHKARVFTNNGIIRATMLVDGFVAAHWRIERDGASATLCISALRTLDRAERDEARGEGLRLLGFVAPDAARSTVRFT